MDDRDVELPAEIDARRLSIDGAGRMEVLSSWAEDACRTINFCEELLKTWEPHSLAREALVLASIFSYARMFASGPRGAEIGEIRDRTFDPAQKALHAFVMNLRDKHYAHSVNSYEEHSCALFLRRNGAPMFVRTVSKYEEGLTSQQVEALMNMTCLLSQAIESAARQLGVAMLDRVLDMSPDEISALPRITIRAADPNDVLESRFKPKRNIRLEE